MQNKSYAVMSQRTEAWDSLDHFPTPRWATRALVVEVLRAKSRFRDMSCWEPACGEGYTAATLKEFFADVRSSDIHNYGYGEVGDFLKGGIESDPKVDWIITNPPYKLAEQFILRALPLAKIGVAMLVRTTFLESVGRHQRLFSPHPPSLVAQFTERVPMVKGRMDPDAGTATAYAWIIWLRQRRGKSTLCWIPPSRRQLERPGDYDRPCT